MQVALVQVCVDERLNHESLRIQVKHKLASLYLNAQRILVLNEVGGNFGENFRNTSEMLLKLHDRIVLAAVLHHDECRSEKLGLRRPLQETLDTMTDFLAKRGIFCILASGYIYTSNNYITWLNDRHVKENSSGWRGMGAPVKQK